MLAEDLLIHADLGLPEAGPSHAPKFTDESCDTDLPTTLLPDIPNLSKWLQTEDDSDDSDRSYGSGHSDKSEESDESDVNDLDEADESEDYEEPDGTMTDDGVDKPWAPPIVTESDMDFRIDTFAPAPLMSVEEHIQKDQYMVDIYMAFKKPWPTPAEVVNDVEIATTILSLVILTTCRKFRLKEQWVDVKNLRLFAEQKLVRENVAEAVRWKRFAVLRTLRLWYEGSRI
ncbi:hypothetical protein CERSUDRAFT_96283 [Gelatoporia subvermispora B]|uniref:Uncharacterized protein n=1 Tax=Ceriporiopsis subvermispora (strain B) TaxID=914234 RepID=M2RCD2_CERS8|nr:hypothetical protein CERSUDRAFT_96283 [Gelatoporia subvermispora B]